MLLTQTQKLEGFTLIELDKTGWPPGITYNNLGFEESARRFFSNRLADFFKAK